ncbi:MAG: hypothetical protein EHM24_06355 [Acidobacteria bacterium]|nr:MAG: hypothetical protein EHM24_06355 [Acidobacteriota bacterium]
MVPDSAVVVWHLRGFIEDVHCFFFARRAGFALAVERAGERLLDEDYDDLPPMMERAREMKDNLLRAGFVAVNPTDATEPLQLDWLLAHFVRGGTASRHAVARAS